MALLCSWLRCDQCTRGYVSGVGATVKSDGLRESEATRFVLPITRDAGALQRAWNVTSGLRRYLKVGEQLQPSLICALAGMRRRRPRSCRRLQPPSFGSAPTAQAAFQFSSPSVSQHKVYLTLVLEAPVH